MITDSIDKAFKTARERKWDRTFWAVDIHETIIVPNYKKDDIPTEWYPNAKEALQKMSERNDIDLILFTCSWPHEIEKYLEMLENEGIHFKYSNENPDIPNGAYGHYEKKFYFNVLFEDKAGFHPREWELVIDKLGEYPDGYGLMDI